MTMDDDKTVCLADEALKRFFGREAGPAEIEALADHVRRCPRCRIRFDALRLVDVEVRSRKREFLALAGRSLREWKRSEKQKALPRRRRWALRAAAVFLMIAAATAAFLLIDKPGAQDGTLRSKGSARLHLISPDGRQSQAPADFRWSEVPDADSYFFELIDDTLETIVPVTLIYSPSFILPPDVRAKLRPGRTYVWSVEARGDDGLKIESSRQSFFISRD
jgi:hypothetical protein